MIKTDNLLHIFHIYYRMLLNLIAYNPLFILPNSENRLQVRLSALIQAIYRH